LTHAPRMATNIISLSIQISMATIQENKPKKRRKRMTKYEKGMLKIRFTRDFGSGKVTLRELARQYDVDWRVLLQFKKEVFGLGSLKQKRMYQLDSIGMPTKAIAEFYGVSSIAVRKNIREYLKKLPK